MIDLNEDNYLVYALKNYTPAEEIDIEDDVYAVY